MDGKEKAVTSPIVLVCQIATHLVHATEASIRLSVSTVLTTRWVLRVNSLVYTATNIHQTALFANVIHVIPDWLVTSNALDKELADRVFVTVTQDGRAKPVKS